jgi:hypothetical protein
MHDPINPAISKSVQAGDIRTNYFEFGEGIPLILLHGSDIGVSAYANWHRTMPVFGSDFRALAPELSRPCSIRAGLRSPASASSGVTRAITRSSDSMPLIANTSFDPTDCGE